MRLFILTLLAIGSANSNAIGGPSGYAYRTGLFAYNPARGEFPVQDGIAQGYVRYLDGSGTQRLLVYNYPEPTYGVRRLSIKNEENPNPLLRSVIPAGIIGAGQQQQEYLLQGSAREAQFRAWCEQRYQLLKAELDKLRAAGQLPSADLIAQIEPLEMLLKGSSYEAVTIAGETAELKGAREEHLRIWNEARLKVLQLEAEQMRLQRRETENKFFTIGELKTGTGGSIELSAPFIGETAEQLLAREEQLRIYNEQLLRVQQLEAANKPAIDFANRIDAEQRPNSETGLKLLPTGVVQETPEVMRAREEHLRLYNEAKLRTENEGYKFETEQNVAAVKLPIELPVQTTLISATKASTIPSTPIAIEQLLPVQYTPEVLRAREEHLKLHNEFKLKAQAEGLKNEKPTTTTIKARPFQESVQQLNVGLKSVAGFDASIATTQPQQLLQIQDTPEVIRAREEHLKLKAQLEGDATKQPILAVRTAIEDIQPQPQPQIQPLQLLSIQETPEVIRAREEHLRLFNEAKLKAEANNPDDDGTYKPDAAAPIAVLRLVPTIQQPIQSIPFIQPLQVTETPEVVRAREEHLRLVNEAKLHKHKPPQQQQITAETPGGSIILKSDFGETLFSEDNAERLREAERIREEERLLDDERQREAARLRDEEKLREAEKLRELERLKEEERLLEVESLRLKQEEEERLENERLVEAKRLREEQQLSESQISTSIIGGQIKAEAQPLALPYSQQSAISYTQPATVFNVQRKENPYFVRFAGEKPSYLINARPLTQNAATYYLPANALKQENPFFLRTTQETLPALPTQRIELIAPAAILRTEDLKKTIGSEKITSGTDNNFGQLSTNMKINYGEGAGLTELERATREHFRAHEIALEQLRLANLKNPNYKDC